MLNKLDVENLSYIADNFPLKSENNESHHSQKSKKPIKLILLFTVPIAEDEENRDNDVPCRLVGIRVPRSCPIIKLRSLIAYIENELKEMYGSTKRANFILTCPEEKDKWELEYQLPMYNVTYI